MANVLIIDDDVEICQMLADLVENIGHQTVYCHTLKEGLVQATSLNFDVIFLDVNMPDGNGLEILPRLRDTHFPPEVIIITGVGDSNGAEMAIKNGAWDYLQKPLFPKNIILPLKRVLQYRDGIKSTGAPPMLLDRSGIIGESPPIRACLHTVAQTARTDANVLITGETGTGKELFARAIHRNSTRSDQPFVVVDCAALPETLVESQLFGHEKGAFTGADRATEGLIAQANRGTLFLDEVGELSPQLQKAFLRVLQERQYRRVGGNHEIASDFRLVAATNKVLEDRVKNRKFRKDLLYRLRSVSIDLPLLRNRKEDLKDLVSYLTGCIFDKQGLEPKGYSPDFIGSLSQFDWPGNVRELYNTLEAAIGEAYHEPILFPKHLPDHLRIKMARSTVLPLGGRHASQLPSDFNAPKSSLPTIKAYRSSIIDKAEKTYLQDLMATTQGSIKKACKISGLGRTRLFTLMKKHGVNRMGWHIDDNLLQY